MFRGQVQLQIHEINGLIHVYVFILLLPPCRQMQYTLVQGGGGVQFQIQILHV